MFKILGHLYHTFKKFKAGLQLSKKLKHKKLNTTKPIVYFKNIKDDRFNRYLFVLVNAFHEKGYNIIFEKNILFLGSLSKYSKIIFEMPQVTISANQPVHSEFIFNAQEGDGIYLNPDYFSKFNPNVYYLPMLMHPLMYIRKYDNQSIALKNRLNSVFFSGAEDSIYSNLSRSFGLLSRSEIIHIISKTSYYFEPKSIGELENVSDKRVTVVLRRNFDVPMENLRNELSKYDFFLACPGVKMPLSHNLTEAMSVGTIPIIQYNYAKQLKPELTENEAIIFNSEHDLLEKLKLIFDMSNESKNVLSNNVLLYYSKYLTNVAILEQLKNYKDYKELRILAGDAGQISVDLFEKNNLNP